MVFPVKIGSTDHNFQTFDLSVLITLAEAERKTMISLRRDVIVFGSPWINLTLKINCFIENLIYIKIT